MDDSWVQARIDATKILVENAESVLSAMLLDDSAANKSYSLNTGQSVVTVTKQNVDGINRFIDSLYNRLATLEARLNGAGGNIIPGY